MPTRTSRGYIWIPPANYPNYKITVTRHDNTVDDVTDYIISGSVTLGATETIGDFSITFDNLDESYSSVYSGGEIVQIYMDYGDATTRIFKGIVDKVGHNKTEGGFFEITLKGRHYAEKLLSITVTKQYTDTEASVIIKDLFDTYATEFTYNNVSTTTNNLTVNWYQKPFWDCITEICNAIGYDAYIDDDLDCHFFEAGSIENTTEAIVHDQNLISVDGFGDDTTEVANRVIVYGQDIEGLPLISSAEDTAAQGDLFVKEKIITDNNITTMTQAQERAEKELERLKETIDRGTCTAYPGLPTLSPGEKIMISDPVNGLTGYYKIISFTHRFNEYGMTTEVTIEREIPSAGKLFKERISAEQNIADIANPYEMRYSWNFTFDDDSQIASHSDTETDEGYLILQAGKSTGTAITTTLTTSNDVTEVHLKVNGNSLVGTNYWVSANNGITWESVTPDTKKILSSPGTKLKLKIELNSSSTQIDSLALLYK